MGGGKKGGKPTIPKEIEQSIKDYLGMSDILTDIGLPLFQQGGSISQDVLNTGTAGALRPAIVSELEATKRQGSEAITGLEAQLTSRGVTGSQFQKALVKPREELAAATAGVPGKIAAPIFEQATGAAFDALPAGLEGLAGVGTIGGASTTPGRKAGGWQGALGGGASGAATGYTVGGPYGAIAGGVLGAGKGAK
jgi:hypothetical protein